MCKKFFHSLKKTIVSEYKYFIFLLALYILFTWPVNYYIVVGGGISKIDERIQVEDGYSSKGGFYISYVSELQGKLSTYLLSYVMPDWKRIDMDDYKYDDSESASDIQFRSDLELEAANSRAISFAYRLAGKSLEVLNTKIYVTSIFEEYDTDLRIQDQLLSIDGHSFSNILEYREYLQTCDRNKKVVVKVLRNGVKKDISCRLYSYKERLILGVSLQMVSFYETDPKIDIQFKKRESGPSGGLMTTLEIYNKLTEDDLTSGKKIAGTGTIEEDGSIGEIGEVEYKLLGAVAGGADIFLVPKGDNYTTCKKAVQKRKLHIQVIPVETIEDAVSKLKQLQ